MTRAEEIVTAAATKCGMTMKDFRVGRRHRVLQSLKFRNQAMSEIRSELGWSYPKIGKYFGNMHHTTVMAAIQRHEAPVSLDAGKVKWRTMPRSISELYAAMEVMERSINARMLKIEESQAHMSGEL